MSKKLETNGFAEAHLAKVIDYKRTFATQSGQKVLHDLIKAHFILQPTYSREHREDVIFKEGQRNVLLRILTILDQDPEKIRKLIREATNGTEE